jgi:hypothetical protein
MVKTRAFYFLVYGGGEKGENFKQNNNEMII